MADGYAVTAFGNILVPTVSPTRRAAIVNYLVAAAGVLIDITWTDEAIEEMWKAHKSGEIRCVKVEIHYAGLGDVTDGEEA